MQRGRFRKKHCLHSPGVTTQNIDIVRWDDHDCFIMQKRNQITYSGCMLLQHATHMTAVIYAQPPLPLSIKLVLQVSPHRPCDWEQKGGNWHGTWFMSAQQFNAVNDLGVIVRCCIICRSLYWWMKWEDVHEWWIADQTNSSSRIPLLMKISIIQTWHLKFSLRRIYSYCIVMSCGLVGRQHNISI